MLSEHAYAGAKSDRQVVYEGRDSDWALDGNGEWPFIDRTRALTGHPNYLGQCPFAMIQTLLNLGDEQIRTIDPSAILPKLRSIRTSRWLTSLDFGQTLCGVLLLYTAKRDRYLNLYRNPGKTLKIGYLLFRAAARRHPSSHVHMSAALCLMGIGVLGLRYKQTCSLCFRACAPALTCCDFHSTSKLSAGIAFSDRKEIVRANRRARKAKAKIPLPNRGPVGAKEGGDREDFSNVIRPFRNLDQVEWMTAIHESLSKASRVREVLPRNFARCSAVCQLSLLRRYLDPHEWDPLAWPAKILAAKDRFAAESSVVERTAGLSPVNRERFAFATTALRHGESVAEIARALGMSVNHLRHVLARGRKQYQQAEKACEA